MLELRVDSLEGTHAVAAAVAGLCRPGDVVVLSGDMGSGKTAFAQGIGRALAITEPITSPTFTLVHSYDIPRVSGSSARQLHHADLYRLERTTEVADLALDELAEDGGIVLVEWGDVVGSMLADHLVVHLERDDLDAVDDDVRLIEISAAGSSWAARWSRLVETCGEFAC
jgi:tRNA threonylcarbamoyladenosine biosynthesis protein TsaE